MQRWPAAQPQHRTSWARPPAAYWPFEPWPVAHTACSASRVEPARARSTQGRSRGVGESLLIHVLPSFLRASSGAVTAYRYLASSHAIEDWGEGGGTRFSEEVAGLKVCVRVRSQYQYTGSFETETYPSPDALRLQPLGYRLRWVRGGWVGARYPSPPPLPPPLPLTLMPTPPSWKSGMDHRREDVLRCHSCRMQLKILRRAARRLPC